MNWTTFGHKKAIQGVYKAYLSDRLSHAYLIIGMQNVGKTTFALDIAKLLNCVSENKPCSECQSCKRIESNNHTDVSVIDIFDPAIYRHEIVLNTTEERELEDFTNPDHPQHEKHHDHEEEMTKVDVDAIRDIFERLGLEATGEKVLLTGLPVKMIKANVR